MPMSKKETIDFLYVQGSGTQPAMSRLVHTVQADGIAVVTVAHPPVNTMDAPLLEGLAALFERLASEPAVRGAVITGEGRAFSAGLDLKLVPTLDRPGQRRLVDALNDAFGTLYAWPKPLVAAVNGHAIAGGLVLALCCDWRIVADTPLEASLAEVRVGVTFPVAPFEIARGELAPAAARRLILLGEALDARRAEGLNVFDERVSPQALMQRALDRAREHAALPRNAFATTKQQLRSAALARIAEARQGRNEPRLTTWIGEEMRRTAAAVFGRAA